MTPPYLLAFIIYGCITESDNVVIGIYLHLETHGDRVQLLVFDSDK